MGGILRPLAKIISAPVVIPYAAVMGVRELFRAPEPEPIVSLDYQLPVDMGPQTVIDVEPNGTVWRRSLTTAERASRTFRAWGRLGDFRMFPDTRRAVEEFKARLRKR